MKLTVITKHVAELTEIKDGREFLCPAHYQSPYFIVQKGRNIISLFEFLTKKELKNQYGRRKYFDMDLSLAEPFETFGEALNIAVKFKQNDISKTEEFYIVGYAEALIVEMYIKQRNSEFNQSIENNEW